MLEQDLETAPVKRPHGRPALHRFHEMKVNDSVFVPMRKNGARVNTNYWRVKLGFVFIARTYIEDGIKGLRIWRVA